MAVMNASADKPKKKVDEEGIMVTEKDIARIRAELMRPCSDETVGRLAKIEKMAQQIRKLPHEDQIKRFRENLEAIRSEAIAKGTAINDEREAAVDD